LELRPCKVDAHYTDEQSENKSKRCANFNFVKSYDNLTLSMVINQTETLTYLTIMPAVTGHHDENHTITRFVQMGGY
jgi:hypothetical protein